MVSVPEAAIAVVGLLVFGWIATHIINKHHKREMAELKHKQNLDSQMIGVDPTTDDSDGESDDESDEEWVDN